MDEITIFKFLLVDSKSLILCSKRRVQSLTLLWMKSQFESFCWKENLKSVSTRVRKVSF